MIEHDYGIAIETSLGIDEADAAVRDALSEEGFGILTEIDVAATLKAKLDVDRRPYRILGACNPVLANRALGVDEHIGLLLPCNVIVYETDSGTRIEAMDPGVMSRVSSAAALEEIAGEARERLERALASVADA
jgi:uncharacterized protein (DUF302 family)